jgi:transcriptional regulator with XRE-family HTH domain
MTAKTSSFERRGKRVSAVVDLSERKVVFSVGGVLAAAAFSVCASTSGATVNAVNPIRLSPGSSSVQVFARDEDVSFSVSEALTELRELTGLTWDQIASMLGVSRRAVHAWMSGASDIRRENAARVQEILHTVRSWSSQPAFKVRNRLLSNFGVSKELTAISGEPPILTSDSTPLKHPVVKKPSSMRIGRA